MASSDSGTPLLAQLLADLLKQPAAPSGQNGETVAQRWLRESELGMHLVEYLKQEAGLLTVASSRLQVTGDEALTQIGRELKRSAQRLRILAGAPTDEA